MRPSVPPLVLLNGLLLGLVALAIVAPQVLDRDSAEAERVIQRYAAAVGAQHLGRAMAEIAPSRREAWTPWVQSQLGNAYDLRGLGVRSPSLLSRLLSDKPGGATEATVNLDVNRAYPDEFYQPTARVPLVREGGRLYLAAPLLAPDAGL